MQERDEFLRQVSGLLLRYARQNGWLAPEAARSVRFGQALCRLIEIRGVPGRLPDDEKGSPGEMDADETSTLANGLLADAGLGSEWAVPASQLVKACFLPEFRTCRESYREQSADGSCRRQQLDKARRRASGSHCVDCPYWTTLTPEQHERCLSKGWGRDLADLLAEREIFLPEDFRTVRRIARAQAR